MREPSRRTGVAQGEALAVWALWAIVAAAIVTTYARLPPADLYHVSQTGLEGGLGRALVFVNYPLALVAIALTLVALDALPAAAVWLGTLAIALCAVTPATVDQADLDARPVNAIPATGVVIALALTAAASRRVRAGTSPREPADAIRLVGAIAILVVSLPWIAAVLGFHFPGDVFMGEERTHEPDGTTIAAVHLGDHHGFNGALLSLSAIVLSRVRMTRRGHGLVLAVYLGLMLAYGLVNCVQDLWLEQVVKRGWADTRIPEALRPELSAVWAVIVALAALAYVVVTRRVVRKTTLRG